MVTGFLIFGSKSFNDSSDYSILSVSPMLYLCLLKVSISMADDSRFGKIGVRQALYEFYLDTLLETDKLLRLFNS
jgi:hypothetical protein